eukprot:COSAG01_NODE_3907_length_5556_cov_8.827378_2_plen_235_part_00
MTQPIDELDGREVERTEQVLVVADPSNIHISICLHIDISILRIGSLTGASYGGDTHLTSRKKLGVQPRSPHLWRKVGVVSVTTETDVMTEVLQHAYDAAVLALKNDCTRFVRTQDPSKAIMFYIYLAVMYEMPTYVEPRGVILRNDWQSIVFDGPGVDHDKDNYLTFGDDARCTLALNSNTKTNANGEQVKRFDISHTRLVSFLRQWEPHARTATRSTHMPAAAEGLSIGRHAE